MRRLEQQFLDSAWRAGRPTTRSPDTWCSRKRTISGMVENDTGSERAMEED